jgi:2-polyprenyl-6-methoxyphenol hydroxylase-like FAD-dependent oxidoreductase
MTGAYLLAGSLKRAQGDHTIAFSEYEARSRPFITRKQRSAEQFAGSFTPKTKFGLLARDIVLRMSAAPWVARWLVRRFVEDRFEWPEDESALEHPTAGAPR